MPLLDASHEEIWKLRDRLFQEFEKRDVLWQNRRKIRMRQMDRDLEGLPLNPRISDRALMVHQTELPNQDCHRRTKRHIANRPRFEVVLFDNDPKSQSLGQALENGIKALYRWMNRGKARTEWKCVEHQQGDGLGILKAEFVPGHGAVLANYDPDSLASDDETDDEDLILAREEFRENLESTGDEAKAYDKVVDKALRSELPPFRMVAVDPITCAWWEDDDGIAVIAESGKKSINPLIDAFRGGGYGLRVVNNRLIVDQEGSEAVSSTTAPSTSQLSEDLSQEVDYTEIRTRDQIAILIEHPRLKRPRGRPRRETSAEARGIVLTFPNPFGPYTTGYALVPGDVTTDDRPEHIYQPPILGLLSIAQSENVLMTAELSAALEEALAPPYVEVEEGSTVLPSEEEKAPTTRESREIPVIAGELQRVPSPKASVKEVEERISREQEAYRFREELVGESQSEASGHRLAVQISQADIQSVPYQNARADAISEIMKGIIFAIRSHGLTVYIPTLPDKERTEAKLRYMEPASITPEMADLNFELITTLGAETAVTKYAKWQALSLREEAGTIGYQTVMEQSDVEDPIGEIERVFEGKLLKATMDQVLPQLVEMVVGMQQRKIDAALGAGPEEEMIGVPPDTGLARGGGGVADADDIARFPGAGMPIVRRSREGGPPAPEPTSEATGRG